MLPLLETKKLVGVPNYFYLRLHIILQLLIVKDWQYVTKFVKLLGNLTLLKYKKFDKVKFLVFLNIITEGVIRHVYLLPLYTAV